jgi:nucleoid DNA-binding protein
MMKLIPQEKLKNQLLKITAERTGMPLAIVEKIIEFQFKDLSQEMQAGNCEVEIANFGKFKVSTIKAGKRIRKLGIKADYMEEQVKSGRLTFRGECSYTARLNSANRELDKIKAKFMRIDIKGIMEGIWNSVFVKQTVEEIAKQRTVICKGCSLNSDHQKKYNNYKTLRPDFHCTDCGCDLHLKTRALSQSCPKGKWLAQITQEQEYELNKKLDETDNNNKERSD